MAIDEASWMALHAQPGETLRAPSLQATFPHTRAHAAVLALGANGPESRNRACLATQWQLPRAHFHGFLAIDESVSAFSPSSANDIGRLRMTVAIGWTSTSPSGRTPR